MQAAALSDEKNPAPSPLQRQPRNANRKRPARKGRNPRANAMKSALSLKLRSGEAGRIIGKKGKYIRWVQKLSGAGVRVVKGGKLLIISGTQSQIRHARGLFESRLIYNDRFAYKLIVELKLVLLRADGAVVIRKPSRVDSSHSIRDVLPSTRLITQNQASNKSPFLFLKGGDYVPFQAQPIEAGLSGLASELNIGRSLDVKSGIPRDKKGQFLRDSGGVSQVLEHVCADSSVSLTLDFVIPFCDENWIHDEYSWSLPNTYTQPKGTLRLRPDPNWAGAAERNEKEDRSRPGDAPPTCRLAGFDPVVFVIATRVMKGAAHDETEEILLVRERTGKWFLPAGHADPGETFERAAIRETKEETGLDVEITGLSQIIISHAEYSALHLVMEARAVTGSVKTVADKESQGAAWCPMAKVRAGLAEEAKIAVVGKHSQEGGDGTVYRKPWEIGPIIEHYMKAKVRGQIIPISSVPKPF